jgi:hypothetical protein
MSVIAERNLQRHPTRRPPRSRLRFPTSATPKTSRLIERSGAFAAAAKPALQPGRQKWADMPVFHFDTFGLSSIDRATSSKKLSDIVCTPLIGDLFWANAFTKDKSRLIFS